MDQVTQKKINTTQGEINIDQGVINLDVNEVLIRMDQRMKSLESINLGNQDILKRNQEVMQDMITSLNKLVSLTEDKVERLLDVVTSKGLVPLPVFKWFAIFVLLFSAAATFGMKDLHDLLVGLMKK